MSTKAARRLEVALLCDTRPPDFCMIDELSFKGDWEQDLMQAALRVPSLAAIAVSGAGFGVMTALWILLPQDNAIPGHWDYASGTLGDALVLPVLVGSLLSLLGSFPPTPTDKIAGAVGASIGACGGLAVQYSWLADNHPRLNWVLPEPGRFSVPGWYHAAFLVVVSSGIAAAFLLALARMREARRSGKQRAGLVPSALFSGSTALFLALVVFDSTPSASTSSSITTISVCCGALATALLPLTLATPGRTRSLVAAQGAGVLGGLAVLALVIAIWPR